VRASEDANHCQQDRKPPVLHRPSVDVHRDHMGDARDQQHEEQRQMQNMPQ
jgi:hypothetical protein